MSSSQKITLLIVLFLVVAVPLTFYVSQHSAENRQRAQVVASPSPTPAPSAPAVPVITSFTVNGSANPAPIANNSNVQLDWATTGATTCTPWASTGTGGWATTTVISTTGSRSVGPINSARILGLVCTGPGGRAVSNVSVTLIPAPVVTLLVNNASGTTWAAHNSTVTVSWNSTDATSCSVSAAQAYSTWSAGTRATSGSMTVGPFTDTATTVRTLGITCTGPGGNGSDSINVYNNSNAVVAAVDLKANGSDFPITVNSGDSVTLSWTSANVSGSTCTTSSSVASTGWTTPQPTSNTGLTIGPITSTRTFTISCTRTGVGSSTDVVTVNVSSVAAPLPTIDLKVDGTDGPSPITYNGHVTATWTSTNATSCTGYETNPIGGWGSTAAINNTTGVSVGVLSSSTGSTVISLQCTGPGGLSVDNVFIYYQSTCGNSVREPGEQCDDGNTVDTDYCSNSCTVTQVGGGSCKFYTTGDYTGTLAGTGGGGGQPNYTNEGSTLLSLMGLVDGGDYKDNLAAIAAFKNANISDGNLLVFYSFSWDSNTIDWMEDPGTAQVSNFLQAGKHMVMVTDGDEGDTIRYVGGVHRFLNQLGLDVTNNTDYNVLPVTPLSGLNPYYAGVSSFFMSSGSRIVNRPGSSGCRATPAGAGCGFGNMYQFPSMTGATYKCQYQIAAGQNQAGYCVWGQIKFANCATIDIMTSAAAFGGSASIVDHTTGQVLNRLATMACAPSQCSVTPSPSDTTSPTPAPSGPQCDPSNPGATIVEPITFDTDYNGNQINGTNTLIGHTFPGTFISDQFSPLGVVFSSENGRPTIDTVIDASVNTHDNYLVGSRPAGDTLADSLYDIYADITNPSAGAAVGANSVTVTAVSVGHAGLIITALDQDGNTVATRTLSGTGDGGLTRQTVTLSGNGITRVTFVRANKSALFNDDGFGIDNFNITYPNYCVLASPTPTESPIPSVTSTPLPTATPSPSPLAQCTAVKFYKVNGDPTVAANWQLLTSADMAALQPGDTVYITTNGTVANTTITMARMQTTIGSDPTSGWIYLDQTHIKPKVNSTDPDEYFLQFLIPSGQSTFNITVGAEVYSPDFDNDTDPFNSDNGWR